MLIIQFNMGYLMLYYYMNDWTDIFYDFYDLRDYHFYGIIDTHIATAMCVSIQKNVELNGYVDYIFIIIDKIE